MIYRLKPFIFIYSNKGEQAETNTQRIYFDPLHQKPFSHIRMRNLSKQTLWEVNYYDT